MLKKILLVFRKLFRFRSNKDEDINPDDFYHSRQTAEGWELVDDLSVSNTPVGENDTARKTSCVKSSLPPYPVVWTYFTANGYPGAEALRFYQRFQMMGWNERIIPTLDNWPELADYWMNLVRESRKHDNPKPPPDDTNPGPGNRDTKPL